MGHVTGSGGIDGYLDDLVVELHGRARDVRRILSEVEDHLRDATEAEVRSGKTPEDAEAAAVARFGSPRAVAGRFGGAEPIGTWVVIREVCAVTVMLVAVGLVAIGFSGIVSAGLRAVFGAEFVAGDIAGVTYTPERCADFLAYHPESASCEAAASAHHADEVEEYRVAAGALGLIVLGAWWWWQRAKRDDRWIGVLPTGFAATVGTSVFAVAAAVLAVLTLNSLALGGSDGGAGQWLSAAAVALIVSVAFGLSLLRTLRRAPTARLGVGHPQPG